MAPPIIRPSTRPSRPEPLEIVFPNKGLGGDLLVPVTIEDLDSLTTQLAALHFTLIEEN